MIVVKYEEAVTPIKVVEAHCNTNPKDTLFIEPHHDRAMARYGLYIAFGQDGQDTDTIEGPELLLHFEGAVELHKRLGEVIEQQRKLKDAASA